MKARSAIHKLLLGACLVVTIGSCSFTKTFKVPVSQPSLYPYLNKKPYWTLEDSTHRIKLLTDVSIRNDSVYGTLRSLQALDHPDLKTKGQTYKTRKWPNSKLYLHLHTNSIPDSEVMAMPLSKVTEATFHDLDAASTTFSNIGLFLAIILIIYL